MDLDFWPKGTIILYLSDEVLYNVMNEKITAGLWCKLKSFYIMKSLSKKFFLKKQLYNFRMKKGTPILQHLNAFNRILSDLLTLEVNLEEKDKTLLLMSSLPPSLWSLCDHHHVWKWDLRVERCLADISVQRADEKEIWQRRPKNWKSRSRGEITE